MTATHSRRTFLGLFGSAAIATGISFVSGAPSVNHAAATTFIAGTPEPKTGEEKPILRLEFTGGFFPVEYTLTAIPAFSLYADGRVITTGPMIEIYPQPALPNLRLMTLTEGGMDRVLTEAKTAGLFDGSASYDLIGIADAQTAVFSLNTGDVSTVVSAYALGFDEQLNSENPDSAARAKLAKLQAFLFNLAAELTPDEIKSADAPYVSEAIRIFARPIDAANPPWQNAIPAPDPIAWPLSTPLSEIGQPWEGPYGQGTRCDAFTLADADTLLKALAGASQLTPWLSEERLFQLWVRPLLPDESGCESR